MLIGIMRYAAALTVTAGLLSATPGAGASNTPDDAKAAKPAVATRPSPAAADAAQPEPSPVRLRGEAYYTPPLAVSLTYEDRAELEVTMTEWSDSLPEYTPVLSESATGQRVGIDIDYADSVGNSELEGPHTSTTSGPLTVGALYDYTLRVRTTGFWHCSIYDPDGCSFRRATDTTYRWRFTWNGSETTGTKYVPPRAVTTIDVTKARRWGKHGWKFTATFLRNGSPAKGRLQGHYAEGRRWHSDSTWTTSSAGKLTLNFSGIHRPYRYKLSAKATSTGLRAESKPVKIPARR